MTISCPVADFKLFCSAVGAMGKESLGMSMMNVNSEGEVQWSPPAHFTVWCDELNFGQWPNDVHTCEAYFGFWTEHENIVLEVDYNNSKVVSVLYVYLNVL